MQPIETAPLKELIELYANGQWWRRCWFNGSGWQNENGIIPAPTAWRPVSDRSLPPH